MVKPTKGRPNLKADARGKDRYATFNAKSNAANKLMDQAFENGKPRKGTSPTSRIVNKAAAWGLYRDATEELKRERLLKESGKRMGRAQALASSKRNKKK